jgi:hypothetical protein
VDTSDRFSCDDPQWMAHLAIDLDGEVPIEVVWRWLPAPIASSRRGALIFQPGFRIC